MGGRGCLIDFEGAIDDSCSSKIDSLEWKLFLNWNVCVVVLSPLSRYFSAMLSFVCSHMRALELWRFCLKLAISSFLGFRVLMLCVRVQSVYVICTTLCPFLRHYHIILCLSSGLMMDMLSSLQRPSQRQVCCLPTS